MDEKIEKQREHFNSIAKTYYVARAGSTHLHLKERMWSAFCSDKKGLLRPGAKVLEPMCGMAEGLQIVEKYLQPMIDYRGFDYSDEMVAAAKQKLPDRRIEWADATTFEAGDARFDLIVLLGGLHHVYDKSTEVVSRLADTLAPGGYFLNLEPTQNCVLTRTIRDRIYRKNPTFDYDTERGFELGELNQQFQRAGMRLVDQVYPGLLSYVLYYNPDAFPWLNRGGRFGVDATFALDRLFWRSWIGRKLSFATLSLWQRSL